MEISEEERQRRSELAKNLHKDGKFGGKNMGQGRPKVRRASQHVAEEARKSAPEIVKAIKDAMKSNSPTVKLKAAIAWLDIERQEEQLRIKEENNMFENASKAELIRYITEVLPKLAQQGVDLPGLTVDSTAEEIDDLTLPEKSRIS